VKKAWVRALSAVCLVSMLMALVAVPALAAEIRTGVAPGEVIDDDVYAAGGAVTVDGTINGDLVAAGGMVVVNGKVTGSVMAAGGTVIVNGEVGHTVRAAGGSVTVNGVVGRDVVIAGGTLVLADRAKVPGDVLCAGGNAEISGDIGGDVKGSAGNMVLSARVGGNVEVEAENLKLTPTARVEGNLTYTSENAAKLEPGAQVGGATTRKLPERETREDRGWPFFGLGWEIFGFLAALVVGVIGILLIPGRTRGVSDALRSRPWHSLAWGALLLFVTPIAIVVMCVTLIGIPLALMTLALYLIALYLCQVIVGLVLGRWILHYLREVDTKAMMVGALALGLIILAILRVIPFLGFFVWLFTFLFGLGALLVWFRRMRAEARKALHVEGATSQS